MCDRIDLKATREGLDPPPWRSCSLTQAHCFTRGLFLTNLANKATPCLAVCPDPC